MSNSKANNLDSISDGSLLGFAANYEHSDGTKHIYLEDMTESTALDEVFNMLFEQLILANKNPR